MDRKLSEDELQDLYAWIDKIPLSRPKRHITRDFSDGVMAAEVVKCFFPKLVDVHNYSPANSTQQKLSNWNLLNRQDVCHLCKRVHACMENMKVFSKLNFHVPEKTVQQIVVSSAGVIEVVLCVLREKIHKKLQHTHNPLDLEYYDTRKQEKLHTESRPAEPKHPNHMARQGEKRKTTVTNSNPQHSVQLFSDMEPAVRVLLQEKEQALMALQETVEILQMKVNRLEHLVHLKDMRIEDLTRHLEIHKAKASMG
ncbi:hypothetical protein LDENG_00094970 [Lucifuga dentata]|nr:hypothetical protein LDENG_00094970 [Lucifuga dentata]